MLWFEFLEAASELGSCLLDEDVNDTAIQIRHEGQQNLWILGHNGRTPHKEDTSAGVSCERSGWS